MTSKQPKDPVWMDYEEYLIKKKWMEERERIFIAMIQSGIPPWEFHRHIKEFEDAENSLDRQ